MATKKRGTIHASSMDHLTLSGGGGGNSEAWMTKLTAANQKPLIL